MNKLIANILLLLLSLTSVGQVAPGKYFVAFTDKNNSPYSISDPGAFLTQRAIDRRNAQYIPVTEEDLPVNPQYVDAIHNLGVTVITRSRWMNGITVSVPLPSLLDSILNLPFVDHIVKSTGPGTPQPVSKFEAGSVTVTTSLLPKKFSWDPADYGLSYNQIHMLNGDLLHQQGYRGEGKVIAILDAGFKMANSLPAFDSLWHNNQILGTKDFVNPGNDVFNINESPHGMEVLSVMGGFLPGKLIGTAPKASFWLLRSEDVSSENVIEEYNWVCAAEFADSVGADVINSSLGYTRFDDTTMSHTCADMNGHTTVVTIGANTAVRKGIMVVNSAGNSGLDATWQCVSAPADGDLVCAAAGVDSLGNYWDMSSKGEVNGNRVKPNVAAMGSRVVVSSTNGDIMNASGTSFSSPITAGLATCLWQSMPGVTPAELLLAMERSASHYTAPDKYTGYGLPDYIKAKGLLGVPEKQTGGTSLKVYPNPFSTGFTLQLNSAVPQNIVLELFDVLGEKVWKTTVGEESGDQQIRVTPDRSIVPGMYFLRATEQGTGKTGSAVIQKVL